MDYHERKKDQIKLGKFKKEIWLKSIFQVALPAVAVALKAYYDIANMGFYIDEHQMHCRKCNIHLCVHMQV